MTGVDLARDLCIDERKAARLVDPRAANSPASLEGALASLGYEIETGAREKSIA